MAMAANVVKINVSVDIMPILLVLLINKMYKPTLNPYHVITNFGTHVLCEFLMLRTIILTLLLQALFTSKFYNLFIKHTKFRKNFGITEKLLSHL